MGRYGCYLFFQLKTHGDMFKGESSDETPSLSLSGALGLLTAITLIVAVASECAPLHCVQLQHAGGAVIIGQGQMHGQCLLRVWQRQ